MACYRENLYLYTDYVNFHKRHEVLFIIQTDVQQMDRQSQLYLHTMYFAVKILLRFRIFCKVISRKQTPGLELLYLTDRIRVGRVLVQINFIFIDLNT